MSTGSLQRKIRVFYREKSVRELTKAVGKVLTKRLRFHVSLSEGSNRSMILKIYYMALCVDT